MTQEPERDTQASRRGVLAGVGLAGLAGAVSACSSGGSSASSAASAPAPASTGGAAPASTAGAASGGTASGVASGGTAASALASTSDIPVGGGKVFSAQKVVVTQPAAGQIKGFSAICTHEQCLVDQVSNGTIDCPCHGSKFSIKDGSVVAGPAPSPLPSQALTVTGTSIALG